MRLRSPSHSFPIPIPGLLTKTRVQGKPIDNTVLTLVCLAALIGSSCAQGVGSDRKASGSRGTASIAARLDPAAANRIGRKIWQNECGGTVEGLTSWNRGEDFASLGIGHFIWYVEGRRGPFEESFPALLNHLRRSGFPLPPWLEQARGCPWPNRDAFLAASQSPQMRELRQLLASSVPAQTQFIVARLEGALPKMTAATPSTSERDRLIRNFHAVAETPHGLYALIDYVNFKGEGTNPSERYQGQGWGLRDVLLEMRGSPRGAAAASEYSAAAQRVLERRVALSPPARNEQRWLAGWTNRCRSYRQPL